MGSLDGLNSEQREAVTHIDGPLLILAGPGSGKTRVITHRVAHMVREGISPKSILAITFTNKAATEMGDRVARLLPDCRIWVSTFHKLCVRLLRTYGSAAGLDSGFVIYDTADQRKLLKSIIQRLEIELENLRPERAANAISRAKNDLIAPEEYLEESTDYFEHQVASVYREYQTQLKRNNAVDFDDLLLHVALMLKRDPEIRKHLDRRFQYILVDEYQDTNLAQYAIVRALSVDHTNLCSTGDPDQSIYGWRGANIQNIMRFESDYPNCKTIRLVKNYRSTKQILAAASHLIQFNQDRKEKELLTDNPDGKPIAIQNYLDEREEARAIASSIRQAVETGNRTWGDFAVFCRISALTQTIEQELRFAQIPYRVLSGVGYFDRKEVKDLLAYLKLLVNPKDDISFIRVVNVPARGVGKSTVEKLIELATSQNQSLLEAARIADRHGGIQRKQLAGLRRFVELIDELSSLPDPTIEEIIRATIDEADFFADRSDNESSDEEPSDEFDERRANVEELVTAAQHYDCDYDDGDLAHFLSEAILTTDSDDEPDGETVSIMTLHAAKGLEYPVVFIVAVEDGILPHSRSRDFPAQFEEERRLLFVGITRAETELQISWATRRRFRGELMQTVPSSFLTELPEAPSMRTPPRARRTSAMIQSAAELVGESKPKPAANLQVGMFVRHNAYGVGRVTALQGYGEMKKATVRFTQGGQRTFVVSKAPLVPIKVG